MVPLNVVLGYGAFGTVSKFNMKGDTVAVKYLFELSDYEREFRALLHLSKSAAHPFIAGLLNYTTKEDKGYLVFGKSTIL